ncbi:MAG TPA: hypothetical protein VGE43_19515 [Acidimicrobiales bacterium]
MSEPSTSYPGVLDAEPWPVWLAAILPGYCTYPFGDHHAELWEWVWAMEPGVRPEAFVAVWPRGGAKSTSAEAACVALGARRQRRYALYVCDTQDRADDHVANIGSMLESDRVEMFYPECADRLVGKFGNSKGWRRNRLRCANGFTVDAIGLDTAARGVKLEDQRPDLIVIDDIDGQHDSATTTRKKVDRITKALIPAGSEDVAVLAVQNLIAPNGVFARIVDGRADFLRRRHVSGPIPALREFRALPDGTVTGEATWEGQSVERCNDMVADMGLRAFRSECQHDTADTEGALWRAGMIDAKRIDTIDTAKLARVVTAVDPSVTAGEDSDDTGIVVAGASSRNFCPVCGPVEAPHLFVLEDASLHAAPRRWGAAAVAAHDRWEGDRVVGEVNNGGDLVEVNLRVADPEVPFSKVNASRGKRVRAEPVAALYGDPEDPDSWERGRVHHVGVHDLLEEQMTSWVPDAGMDSPDRLDALVWAVTELALGTEQRRVRYRSAA